MLFLETNCYTESFILKTRFSVTAFVGEIFADGNS